MKRRTFLAAPLFVSTIDTYGLSQEPVLKAVKVEAGKDRNGKSFTYLGARFDLKVSGKDCHGTMSIYDTVRFEKKGPVMHSHSDLDEWFFVSEGEFKFKIGAEMMTLKAGDSVLGPKGVPHAFIKISEGPARLLIQHAPAGTMEEYFHEVMALEDQSLQAKQELMRKHNMMYVGPPLIAD